MSDEAVNATQEVNVAVDLAPEAHTDAGALSFDELDALTDSRSEKQVVNEAKEKVAEETQKDESKAEVQSGGKESQEESEVSEEAIEEIKKILARQGDDELEIAADAIFKQKVDGEEVDVSLQDLLNNYSGKQSYDKKFQELSENKKDFETNKQEYDKDIEDIYSVLNGFKDKMQNNDAMGALEYFASFAGMKPYEFRENLIRAMAPEVARMSQMSEEQLLNERLQSQNDYLLQQQESENAKLQEKQSLEGLRQEISQVQEAHGISDEDFQSAYQELADSDYKGEISPGDVAEFYIHTNAYKKADQILESVNPSLTQDNNILETFQKIIVDNPSFDDNDLLDIVKEVYGNVEEQASKSVSKKAKPVKQEKQNINQRSKEAFVSFEDL